MLEEQPTPLDQIGRRLFPEQPEQAVAGVTALVDLAAQARPAEDDQPLLPARYHFFVRAIEGAYVCLCSPPRLLLERRERFEVDGSEYPVFELAVCRQCGAAYLVGERTETQDGKDILTQPGPRSFEHPSGLEFFLLPDERNGEVPDDEDELVSYGPVSGTTAEQRLRLCVRCGAIDRADAIFSPCDCTPPQSVRVIGAKTRDGNVHVCRACGSRSTGSVVFRFLTGNDAAASVLATALYQEIPPREIGDEVQPQEQQRGIDEWSSTAGASASGGARAPQVGGGRQLLIFSDSRQDAAFFAPYLNRTYSPTPAHPEDA